MIKILRDEQVVVVYDKKTGVYFYRPLSGIETELSNEDISNRIQFRVKKWRQ